MLSNTLNLSYIDEGETVASDHGFTKDGYPVTPKGVSYANFVADAWVDDPSLPKNWITMTPTVPKKTSNFNGVRRGHVAIYREVTVPTPDGATTEAVANIHINSSLPDGMTGEQIEEMVRYMVAVASSTAVLDHMKSSQV